MKKSIGLDIEHPKENLSHNDKKCPFFGEVSIRGKTFEGEVVSDLAQKTVKVCWDRYVKVKKYNRYLKKKSSVLAHNSDSVSAKKGDKVLIAETRPLSKRKHFAVVKVLKKMEESQK